MTPISVSVCPTAGTTVVSKSVGPPAHAPDAAAQDVTVVVPSLHELLPPEVVANKRVQALLSVECMWVKCLMEVTALKATERWTCHTLQRDMLWMLGEVPLWLVEERMEPSVVQAVEAAMVPALESWRALLAQQMPRAPVRFMDVFRQMTLTMMDVPRILPHARRSDRGRMQHDMHLHPRPWGTMHQTSGIAHTGTEVRVMASSTTDFGRKLLRIQLLESGREGEGGKNGGKEGDWGVQKGGRIRE